MFFIWVWIIKNYCEIEYYEVCCGGWDWFVFNIFVKN